jgi:competence protein ComEA
MDTAPPPIPPSPPTLPSKPPSFTAWPKSAQWATAFLFGVAAASLLVHVLSSSRWWSRPADLERGAVPRYRVDLNKADRAELQQLPGVGDHMADRIETQRRTKGPFHKVDDLKTVKGIGPATVNRLRDWVEVEPNDDGDPVDMLDPADKAPKSKASSTRKKAPSAPVDVNRASLEELKAIPGVGPSYAQHIIDERAKKPFERVDDLTRVPGIKERKLESLRPYVTVGSTSSAVR